MNGNKILVVDDESDITELIKLYLEREGFEVHSAEDGETAIRLAESLAPDLIILDVLLQSLDGIEICKRIRAGSAVPILFLSCKSDDIDIIHGLTVGGDDYVTKPFSPSQLVARVKAHLRRQSIIGQQLASKEYEEILTYDSLVINLPAREVYIGDREVPLSAKEYDLFAYLAQSPNRAISLDELFRVIWGHGSLGDTRTLMVHISNIRKKIEPDPANPVYILTIRGFGYKFNVKEG